MIHSFNDLKPRKNDVDGVKPPVNKSMVEESAATDFMMCYHRLQVIHFADAFIQSDLQVVQCSKQTALNF